MDEKSGAAIHEENTQSGGTARGTFRKILPVLLAAMLIISMAGNVVLYMNYDRQKTFIEEMDVIYSENYFHFDSLTVDSFKEKVTSGEEFVVVITRPNCPNCTALEAPVIELAEQKGIADKIYHLNVVLLRRDADAWAKFKETYGFEGTPTYARFAGGKMVSSVGWTYANGIDFPMAEKWINEQDDFWYR